MPLQTALLRGAGSSAVEQSTFNRLVVSSILTRPTRTTRDALRTEWGEVRGAGYRNRTRDLRFTKPLLYLLS